MAFTRDSTFDPSFDPDELSWPRRTLHRLETLAEDLPFVPLTPYEPRRRQLAWRAAMLFLLAASVFAASVGPDWLWRDEHISSDLALRTADGLANIWTRPFDGADAPMTRTFFWLTHHLFGPEPIGFRAVSIAFHATTAVLLWFTLRRLNVAGAWLAAAVFAVHPAALPNVTWASRQGDLIGVFASALAVWAYLRAREIRPPPTGALWTDPEFHGDTEISPRWPWVIFGSAVLIGLTSGSAAVCIAPLVVLTVESCRRDRPPAAGMVALIAWAILTVAGRLAFSPFKIEGAAESAIAASWSIFHTLLPIDSPFVFDRVQWTQNWVMALAGVSIAIVALGVVCRRFAWSWPLVIAVAICALHASTAARPEPAAIATADLVSYAMLLLLVPIVVGGLIYTVNRRTAGMTAIAIRWLLGFLLIGGFGAATSIRSTDYATADAIWQRTLVLNPDSVFAREELASRYLAEGFVDEAALQLDRVPDDRRDARWLLTRGRTFDAQKRYIDAASCFENAHRLHPGDTSILISYAEAETSAGRPEKAASLYTDLLQRLPADPGLLTNAGLTQVRLGHPQAAADLYEKALAVDPRYLPAHINLANVLFELGKFEDASNHLQQAVKIDPRNFPAFMNAGILLHRLREPAKAERMFRAAVTIDPTSADAFDDLGIVLAAQNKLSEAAWSFTQATHLNPDHAAKDHLSEVRRQLAAKAATQPER